MHPSMAHDLVEQHMKDRLDAAAAERLGRGRRIRRTGRVPRAASDEPKLRELRLVTPCTT